MIDLKIFFVRFIGLFAIIFTVLGFIFFGVYFWPFLVASIVAFSMAPIVRFLNKKIKIPNKLAVGITVALIYLILGFVIALICIRLVKEATVLVDIIPNLYNKSVDMFNNNFDSFKKMYSSLPDTLSSKIYDIGTNVLTQLTNFAIGLINGMFDFVLFLPTMIIYIVVTILATYFLATDKSIIYDFFEKTLPKRWLDNFVNIINKSIKSLISYFKAQLMLAGISFICFVVGFLIIGQSYPFTIALILAILDILPVVGVGTGMIPWIIYCGMTGDIRHAVVLTIVYGIAMVIRQLLEPKIIGNSIGIKPIITLATMFIGFKIFGILGMLIGPIITIILKDVLAIVLETGYLKSMFVEKKPISIRYFKRYE